MANGHATRGGVSVRFSLEELGLVKKDIEWLAGNEARLDELLASLALAEQGLLGVPFIRSEVQLSRIGEALEKLGATKALARFLLESEFLDFSIYSREIDELSKRLNVERRTFNRAVSRVQTLFPGRPAPTLSYLRAESNRSLEDFLNGFIRSQIPDKNGLGINLREITKCISQVE